MEKKRSKGITVIACSIIAAYLILLLVSLIWPSLVCSQIFFLLYSINESIPGYSYFAIILAISVLGIILGIGILFLNNIARLVFIIFQILYAIIILPSFIMYSLAYIGQCTESGRWSSSVITKFWQQITYCLPILVIVIPLLLSIFYIYYLTRPKVKEQF